MILCVVIFCLPFKLFMTFMVDIFLGLIRSYLCSSVSQISFFVFLRALRGKRLFFLFFIVIPAAPRLLSVFPIYKMFHEAGHRQIRAVP